MSTPLQSPGNSRTVSSNHQRWRFLGFILLGVYLAMVAVTVFWPVHVDDNSSGEFVKSLLHTGHHQGWLPLWFTYSSLEWLSNVVMFIPGGFLLTLLIKQKMRKWVPVGAIFSTVIIETIQKVMPGRTSSLWDILANSIGGAMGWVCALAFLWILKRKRVGKGIHS